MRYIDIYVEFSNVRENTFAHIAHTLTTKSGFIIMKNEKQQEQKWKKKKNNRRSSLLGDVRIQQAGAVCRAYHVLHRAHYLLGCYRSSGAAHSSWGGTNCILFYVFIIRMKFWSVVHNLNKHVQRTNRERCDSRILFCIGDPSPYLSLSLWPHNIMRAMHFSFFFFFLFPFFASFYYYFVVFCLN